MWCRFECSKKTGFSRWAYLSGSTLVASYLCRRCFKEIFHETMALRKSAHDISQANVTQNILSHHSNLVNY